MCARSPRLGMSTRRWQLGHCVTPPASSSGSAKRCEHRQANSIMRPGEAPPPPPPLPPGAYGVWAVASLIKYMRTAWRVTGQAAESEPAKLRTLSTSHSVFYDGLMSTPLAVNWRSMCLLVLLAFSGVGCTISQEQEIALGRKMAPQFEQEFGGLYPDEQV